MASDTAIMQQELESCKAQLKVESRRNSTWLKAYERLKTDFDRVVAASAATANTVGAHQTPVSYQENVYRNAIIAKCKHLEESGTVKDDLIQKQKREIRQLQESVTRLEKENGALKDSHQSMVKSGISSQQSLREYVKRVLAKNAVLEKSVKAKDDLAKKQLQELLQLRDGVVQLANENESLKSSELHLNSEVNGHLEESRAAEDSHGPMVESAMGLQQNIKKGVDDDLNNCIDYALAGSGRREENVARKRKREMPLRASVIILEGEPNGFVESGMAPQEHLNEDLNQLLANHSAVEESRKQGVGEYFRETQMIHASAVGLAKENRELKESHKSMMEKLAGIEKLRAVNLAMKAKLENILGLVDRQPQTETMVEVVEVVEVDFQVQGSVEDGNRRRNRASFTEGLGSQRC